MNSLNPITSRYGPQVLRNRATATGGVAPKPEYLIRKALKTCLQHLRAQINPGLYSSTALQSELSFKKQNFEQLLKNMVIATNWSHGQNPHTLQAFFVSLGCHPDKAKYYAQQWRAAFSINMHKGIIFELMPLVYPYYKAPFDDYYYFSQRALLKITEEFAKSPDNLVIFLNSINCTSKAIPLTARNWKLINPEDKYLLYREVEHSLYVWFYRPSDFAAKHEQFKTSQRNLEQAYTNCFANCFEYTVFMQIKISAIITWLNKRLGCDLNITYFWIKSKNHGDHMFNGLKCHNDNNFYLFDEWGSIDNPKLVVIKPDHHEYLTLEEFCFTSTHVRNLEALPRRTPIQQQQLIILNAKLNDMSTTITNLMNYRLDNVYVSEYTQWRATDPFPLPPGVIPQLNDAIEQDNQLIKLKLTFIAGNTQLITQELESVALEYKSPNLKTKSQKMRKLAELFTQLQNLKHALQQIFGPTTLTSAYQLATKIRQIDKDLIATVKHPEEYHGLQQLKNQLNQQILHLLSQFPPEIAEEKSPQEPAIVIPIGVNPMLIQDLSRR